MVRRSLWRMERSYPRVAVLVKQAFRTNRLIRTQRAQDRSILIRTMNSSAHCKWSDETRTNALSTINLPTSTDTHETLPITFLHDIWTST